MGAVELQINNRIVGTGNRCSQRGCPFFSDYGSILCRQHRMSFTYGTTLEDRGSPLTRSPTEGWIEGFSVPAKPQIKTELSRKAAREAKYSDVQVKSLVSGNMLVKILGVLRVLSLPDRSDYFTHLEPAQGLFTAARFPELPFCALCGSPEYKTKHKSGGRPFFVCGKCSYSYSCTTLTFFSKARLFPPEWLRAIWTFDQEGRAGAKSLRRQLNISANGARYIGTRLHKAAVAVGMDIGWYQPDRSIFVLLADRPVTIKQWRGESTCSICDESIAPGQRYRRVSGRLEPAAHENCWQLGLVKQGLQK